MRERPRHETQQRARGVLYPMVGGMVALCCPLGLLLLRALHPGQPLGVAWVLDELRELADVYLYLTVMTTGVLVLLGRMLGRMEDRLRSLALHDPLTGLANRRMLRSELAVEVARAERHQAKLALLAMDLDGLKSLNDRLGHAMGDQAICLVATSLRTQCRAVDLPARVGGDEFVVLARDTDLRQAESLADRIRNDLRERSTARFVPPLTVSIGIVGREIGAGGAIGGGAALLDLADRALYQAKHRGRDRHVTLNGPWSGPPAVDNAADSGAVSKTRSRVRRGGFGAAGPAVS